MLPILLPLTVENPGMLILGIIICSVLALCIAFLIWLDHNSVTYLDEKCHEQYFPNFPEYVYKALMQRDEWTFLSRPRLFKWLDKYGEVWIDEKHVMRKLSDGLYGDNSGNSWEVRETPRYGYWAVQRRSGTSSNKKGPYNPYV